MYRAQESAYFPAFCQLDPDLSVLQYVLVFNVLIVARILTVGLHPTNILTPAITPLLQTLTKRRGRERERESEN